MDPPDVIGGDACDREGAFGAPILVAGVNTASSEPYAWLSPDELVIYFTSDRPGSADYDVYTATRASLGAPFGTAVRVAASTVDGDLRPSLTADGLTMFAFITLHTGSSTEIVEATRSDRGADFGAFTTVGELGSVVEDEDPDIDASGHVLYFTSARAGSPDLYVATRADTATHFGAPVPLAEINTPSTEDVPVISDDGLELFFASDRERATGLDIWTARRDAPSAAFGAASRVALSSGNEDWPVWLSPDRCRLYFVSADRAGGAGGRDIWVAARPPAP